MILKKKKKPKPQKIKQNPTTSTNILFQKCPLFSLVRRKSSSIPPLAAKFAASQSRYNHRIIHNLIVPTSCSTVSRRRYSSQPLFRDPSPSFCNSKPRFAKREPTVYESLLQVLESSVEAVDESRERNKKYSDHNVEEAPDGFPFRINDNPGQLTVTLTREYMYETIKVDVQVPAPITQNEDDSNAKDDGNQKKQACLPMIVQVSRKDGPTVKFTCIGLADKISIQTMSVKGDPESTEELTDHDQLDFADFKDELQNGFHKYLELMGINSYNVRFLIEYMKNKDCKEYVAWFKDIKQFLTQPELE